MIYVLVLIYANTAPLAQIHVNVNFIRYAAKKEHYKNTSIVTESLCTVCFVFVILSKMTFCV